MSLIGSTKASVNSAMRQHLGGSLAVWLLPDGIELFDSVWREC